jgi:hypothetical protein
MTLALERKHRIYVTVFIGSAAFVAALMLTALVTIPLAWYFPVAREWRVTTHPNSLAVDWYGRTLLALVSAAIASAVSWLLSALLPAPKTERVFRWLALWTALLLLFASALYGYQLSGRAAPPEPLPLGYVPR